MSNSLSLSICFAQLLPDLYPSSTPLDNEGSNLSEQSVDKESQENEAEVEEGCESSEELLVANNAENNSEEDAAEDNADDNNDNNNINSDDNAESSEENNEEGSIANVVAPVDPYPLLSSSDDGENADDEYMKRILLVQSQYEDVFTYCNGVMTELLKAEKAAQCDDEESLEKSTKAFTDAFKNVGLPLKPSTLHKHLDNDLLDNSGLINPQHITDRYNVNREKNILQPLPTMSFYTDTKKNYLKQTKATSIRTSHLDKSKILKKTKTYTEEDMKKLEASNDRRSTLFNTQSADQRRIEDDLLYRMNAKKSYLRNPRFQGTLPQAYRPSLVNKHIENNPHENPENPESPTSPTSPSSKSYPRLLTPSFEEELVFIKETRDRNKHHKSEFHTNHIQKPLSTLNRTTGRQPFNFSSNTSMNIKPRSPTMTLSADPNLPLQPEPVLLEFSDYKAGGVYEQTIKLLNITNVSRRLRVLPPTSQDFSLVSVKFPSTAGLIAPGMHCECVIRFEADSLSDVSDFLTIDTELNRFQIPVIARRPPPKLTLFQTIDLGECILDGSSTHSFEFEFTNLGGEGRFLLIPEEEYNAEFDVKSQMRSLTIELDSESMNETEVDNSIASEMKCHEFSVFPNVLSLQKDQSSILRVSFDPNEATGQFTRRFKMVCDNCQVQTFTLTALSILPVVIPKYPDVNHQISVSSLFDMIKCIPYRGGGAILKFDTTNNESTEKQLLEPMCSLMSKPSIMKLM